MTDRRTIGASDHMSHHVRWSAAGLLVIGLCLGTAQHLHLFAGNDSTALPAGEAQRRYDDATTSTSAGAGPTATSTVQLPVPVAPGVYKYATTGGDSVDALQGAHHDYPALTTITVTPVACGVQQRWDVLQERWEEWRRCTDGIGVTETGRTNHDEFFGQSQTDTWRCDGDARPLVAEPGTTWSTRCTIGSAIDTYDGVVVGAEQQTVGTSTVDTQHVRVTVSGGEPSDSQIIDTWYLAGTDLVVVQTSIVATSNDSPVGTVHYAETYEIRLTSLTPSG